MQPKKPACHTIMGILTGICDFHTYVALRLITQFCCSGTHQVSDLTKIAPAIIQVPKVTFIFLHFFLLFFVFLFT